MKARFVQQGATVDYIPTADVKAGEIVVVNDLVGVSRYDIKAGELGALAVLPAPVCLYVIRIALMKSNVIYRYLGYPE